jgi:hypothetical protein
MKIEIPQFILDLSKQLNEQPSRATAHPFYQVRCKRPYVTQEGYDSKYFEIYDEDSAVFSSNWKERGCKENEFAEYLVENHHDWLCDTFDEIEVIDVDFVIENFDFEECDNLPDGLTKLWIQEVEEVVSTHLTLDAAEQFIKRKQHDYPKLYTYAESAYWCPQLRQLQDWLKSLSELTP